jgi:hypothetical protein
MPELYEAQFQPAIPKSSMWRIKENRPFSTDTAKLYGETVLVRKVSEDAGVQFHTRGGKGLEARLEVNDFMTWFAMCHREGEDCTACHPDRA